MAEKVRNKSTLLGKLLKILFNIVIFLVCVIAFVLIAYVFLAQIHKDDNNYKPSISFYTIVSPSMNPVIKVYDVVVNIKPSGPEDIEIGDIITYVSTNSTSEGMTITHRVVAITKAENGNYEYQTQGDNNSEPDGVLVTYDNVIGKEIMIIPKLGKIQFLLANKKSWLLLLLIPVMIFVFKDIYDLIELFGLRRKVDDVTGYIEEPTRVRKNELEIKQKEILKRELSIHAVREDALVRKPTESEGFLEPYSESIIEVGKSIDSDKKEERPATMKIVKPVKIEGEEIRPNTDDEEFNKKVQELKPVVSSIEVLDTDELTTKIKDYDDKVSKLNEMLNDLEKMKINKEKEISVEKERVNREIIIEKERAKKEIEAERAKVKEELQTAKEQAGNKDIKSNTKKIVDSYLIGRKIKVVGSEETKNRRKKRVSNDKKILLGKKKTNINSRLVIEKPKAEDLPKIKNDVVQKKVVEEKVKSTPIINNRELNLKNNQTSKKKKSLSTEDVILRELNTINKKDDKDLIFNPKMVKKVDVNKKKQEEKKPEKKRGLIYIAKREKVKK